MSQKKKGDVSIANILAIIGLAAYGVISFMGAFFGSTDGKPGRAILLAVGLVILLAGILILCIKAKKAEDNPDKWRFVEWGCLAAYVLVVALCSGSFHRFFSVVQHKDSLQEAAREELAAMEALADQYESQSSHSLNLATVQLKNYLASSQTKSGKDSLSAYVSKYVTDVDIWSSSAVGIVSANTDGVVKSLEDDIAAWNYMRLPPLAQSLDGNYVMLWDALQEKIAVYGRENGLIPVISGGGGSPYVYSGLAPFDLGERPVGTFAGQLQSVQGFPVISWIVLVLLHLLVLLNYLVAPRTHFVKAGRSESEDFSDGAVL